MPLEKWTQEVNDGKATTEQYFVLQNLADRIDELVAAKNARRAPRAISVPNRNGVWISWFDAFS